MNVAGGKYVATANESSASGTCALGYAKAAHTVTYGDTSECGACTGATYADKTGQASCSACPTSSQANIKSYSYWNGGKTGDHTVRKGCSAYFKQPSLANGTVTQYRCYIDTSADTYGLTGDTAHYCEIDRDWLTCNSGYYNKAFNDYPEAMYDTRYKTITNLLANACVPVEAGYWSANESLSRTACASGLTTIGYGFGANEEDDCGRIFNYGNQKIYLRSAKRGDASQPALHVKIGDVIFYGTMKQVSGPQSGFNAEYGGKNYLITNDDQ